MSKLHTAIILAAAPMAALPFAVMAQNWSGSGELGYTNTTGNTDTTSLNAKAGLARSAEEIKHWAHDFRAEALTQEENSSKTAERYLLTSKSDYRFSELSYSFGKLRYEDDRFSGYDYTASAALGIGRKFINTDTTLLDISAGPGYRERKEETSGETEDNVIAIGNLKFNHKLSQTSEFSEELLVESGQDNTYSESVTGLKSNIRGNLAMKLSYTVKHNSNVPVGTKKADTITAVTLVYDFL